MCSSDLFPSHDILFKATIYSESGCNVNANSKTIVLADAGMYLNAPHIQFYRILHTSNTLSITLYNNLNVDILEFKPVGYGYTVNIGGAYQLNCKQFIIGGAGGETVMSDDITINVSESLYIRGSLNRKTIGGIFTLNLLSGATQDVRCNASYVDSSGIVTGKQFGQALTILYQIQRIGEEEREIYY